VVGGRTPRPTGPKARVPVVIADTDRFTAVSRLLDQADTSPNSRVQFRSLDEGRAARWADRITGAEGRGSGEDHSRGQTHEDSLATRTLRCVEHRARSHRWLHLANPWTHAL